LKRPQASIAILSAVLLAAAGAGVFAGIRLVGSGGSPLPDTSPRPRPTPSATCSNGWHISSGDLLPGRVPQLFGSAAVSWSDVWAVGTSYASDDSGDYTPLTEHFDGQGWRVVHSPVLRQGTLVAAEAISSNDVWAIGNVAQVQPLIEHWDGRSWKVVQGAKIAPNEPPDIGRQLLSITAIDANDVWVLGHYSPAINVPGIGAESISRDVFEHWDGGHWTLVPSPQERSLTAMSAMQSISAVSANDVWAVGGRIRGFGEAGSSDGALVQHWDGRSWKRVVPPTGKTPLSVVGAISSSDVWPLRGGDFEAVGGYGLGHAQLMHWNGRAWNGGPKITGSRDWPAAVTSISGHAPNDVWTVGTQGRWGNLPFVLHWDGRKWTQVASLALETVPRSSVTRMTVDNVSDGAIVAFGSELNVAPELNNTPQNRIWLRCP